MPKLSTARLKQAEQISRVRAERAVEEINRERRTMTHTALDDDHLVALELLAGKYDVSVAELCTRMIIEWLESSD